MTGSLLGSLIHYRDAVGVFYRPSRQSRYDTRVGWKIHWLTNILLWNVTKWDLSFKIATIEVHTFLSLVLQHLDPIGKKYSEAADTTSSYEFLGQFIFRPTPTPLVPAVLKTEREHHCISSVFKQRQILSVSLVDRCLQLHLLSRFIKVYQHWKISLAQLKINKSRLSVE